MPARKSSPIAKEKQMEIALLNSLRRILSKAKNADGAVWSEAQIKSIADACALAAFATKDETGELLKSVMPGLGAVMKKLLAESESNQIDLLAGLEKRLAEVEKKAARRSK